MAYKERMKIMKTELTEYIAIHQAEILDDVYHNYDSKIVAEDLSQYAVRMYFEMRENIVRNAEVSYNTDAEGVTTMMVTKSKAVDGRAQWQKGFLVIRNLSGSYDIHEFWRI